MIFACRFTCALELAVLALVLFGCRSESKLASVAPMITAGTWAGESKGAVVTLSLSKDGRFQTVFSGGKFRAVVRGQARIVHSELVLMATEINGKPAGPVRQETPVKFHFTPEWSTLTSSGGLTLKRKI